ncbi:hypothetical protein JAO73_10650 [Hymenobacter sp. BT523]|uniref:hypothetical protein n=1 Tax=Hymenobacter sp. BT523 TaxID=2795725 RepID=UPI0018EBB01B|nr:hypothetical protein [Hymenobacter sp. BT523]MBJ6109475.1 hypothetical protein [Hymenobacter sp. BT523]
MNTLTYLLLTVVFFGVSLTHPNKSTKEDIVLNAYLKGKLVSSVQMVSLKDTVFFAVVNRVCTKCAYTVHSATSMDGADADVDVEVTQFAQSPRKSARESRKSYANSPEDCRVRLKKAKAHTLEGVRFAKCYYVTMASLKECQLESKDRVEMVIRASAKNDKGEELTLPWRSTYRFIIQ